MLQIKSFSNKCKSSQCSMRCKRWRLSCHFRWLCQSQINQQQWTPRTSVETCTLHHQHLDMWRSLRSQTDCRLLQHPPQELEIRAAILVHSDFEEWAQSKNQVQQSHKAIEHILNPVFQRKHYVAPDLATLSWQHTTPKVPPLLHVDLECDVMQTSLSSAFNATEQTSRNQMSQSSPREISVQVKLTWYRKVLD